MTRADALLVATVSKSLLFQSPAMLTTLQRLGYALCLAAAPDDWTDAVMPAADWRPLPVSRRPRPQELWRARQQLKGILREKPWALVQVQSPIAAAVLRSLPDLRSFRSIYVAHGFHFHANGSTASNFAFKTIERGLAGRTSALALVSGEDFEAAKRMRLGDRTLVWRLPGAGVDLQEFRPAEAPAYGPPTVLFCGDLNANKDPILAVRAVRQARRRFGLDMRLKIIGSGPLGPGLARVASEETWVTWHAYVPPEKMPTHMARASVLIAPSHREGLPRVIIEALACGVPVVARSNRGSRELLAPLSARWLLEGDDLDAWARAVAEAAEVGRLPKVDVEAARPYGLAAFTRSYEAMVRRVASAPSGRGAYDLADQL